MEGEKGGVCMGREGGREVGGGGCLDEVCGGNCQVAGDWWEIEDSERRGG